MFDQSVHETGLIGHLDHAIIVEQQIYWIEQQDDTTTLHQFGLELVPEVIWQHSNILPIVSVKSYTDNQIVITTAAEQELNVCIYDLHQGTPCAQTLSLPKQPFQLMVLSDGRLWCQNAAMTVSILLISASDAKAQSIPALADGCSTTHGDSGIGGIRHK